MNKKTSLLTSLNAGEVCAMHDHPITKDHWGVKAPSSQRKAVAQGLQRKAFSSSNNIKPSKKNIERRRQLLHQKPACSMIRHRWHSIQSQPKCWNQGVQNNHAIERWRKKQMNEQKNIETKGCVNRDRMWPISLTPNHIHSHVLGHFALSLNLPVWIFTLHVWILFEWSHCWIQIHNDI